MNVKELRAKAKQLGLTGYSRMKKDELIESIAIAEPNRKKRAAKPAELNIEHDGTMASSLGQGTVKECGEYLGTLSKGEARKVRKALRAAGFNSHAGCVRIVGRKAAIAA